MTAPLDSVRSVARWIRSGPIKLAKAIAPGAASRPPWDRNALEDIAARRPWNIRVKAERVMALMRMRVAGLRDGVTVVIVNWNTKQITADVIMAVQELSPPATRILVVDNGSTDGSRSMLRRWSGIRTILLHSNAGHGAALDIALCRVRTRIAVTLDSDAIPLRTGWLEPAVAPVREGRAVLAGQRSSRNFVHPVYAAVDTEQSCAGACPFRYSFLPGSIRASHTGGWTRGIQLN